MPGMGLDIEIRGVEELEKKLQKGTLMAKPMKWLWDKAIFYLEREVKQRTPVHTGRLRASFGGGSFRGGAYAKGTGIAKDKAEVPLFVKFGTNVQYASFVEARGPRIGGVGERHFFRNAVVAVGPKLRELVEEMSQMIMRIWRA